MVIGEGWGGGEGRWKAGCGAEKRGDKEVEAWVERLQRVGGVSI